MDAATFMMPTLHGAAVSKPALDMRTLKRQAAGREKAARLRAAIAKMRLKVMKLEHKVTRLRQKIEAYEDKANRLDEGYAPSTPPLRP